MSGQCGTLLLRTQNCLSSKAHIRSLYPALELAPNLGLFSTMKLLKEKVKPLQIKGENGQTAHQVNCNKTKRKTNQTNQPTNKPTKNTKEKKSDRKKKKITITKTNKKAPKIFFSLFCLAIHCLPVF